MSFNRNAEMSAALALRDELPRALARVPEPSKVIAFKAKVSKRTIDGAKRGEHVVTAGALLDLARQYEPVRQLVLRLIGAEPGEDTRLLVEIQNMIARAGK